MPTYTQGLDEANPAARELRAPDVYQPTDRLPRNRESAVPVLNLGELVRNCVNAMPYSLNEEKLGPGE